LGLCTSYCLTEGIRQTNVVTDVNNTGGDLSITSNNQIEVYDARNQFAKDMAAIEKGTSYSQ